jgi:DNA repair photolyase
VLVGIAKLASESVLLEEKTRVDYRELEVRTFLNRCMSRRVPFDWTINPYRGCEFGCKYCYARYTHEFMELRNPSDFETKIFAKRWNEMNFRAELRRIAPAASIAIGTATDPYQPAERRYEITQRILEVLAGEKDRRISITTKSDLVARDTALLARIAARNSLFVTMTVTTTCAKLARLLEPMAPRPDLRLAAVARLSAAGIRTGVFSSPVLPGINDSEESLDAVAIAAQQSGAGLYGAQVVFLQPCAQAVFLPFLEEAFPELSRRYESLFAHTAFLHGEYPERIRSRVAAIRKRHGIEGLRPDRHPPAESPQRELF